MSRRQDLSLLDLHVVLVEPEIPPNTGNIARLCVGVGATLHLVGRLGFSTDDAALKRAGLDYWKHLTLRYHDTLHDLWATVPRERFHYLTTKTERPYTAVRYRPGDFLVFGSESAGLPRDVLAMVSDRLISIPMTGITRSHNLSNAVAIVVYEAARQLTGGFAVSNGEAHGGQLGSK